MFGIYIHIPFCTKKCHYCDFNSYEGIGDFIPSYLAALQQEITLWSGVLGRQKVSTIYIGGGTPSLLSEQQFSQLILSVRQMFCITPDSEVTVEANPESIKRIHLPHLRSLGINRLSIGVQSFLEAELQQLGRTHTVEDVIQVYRMARDAGFDNLNFDLIYGLPDQTPSDWQRNLEQAIALAPEHLSLYALTVEPHTPLYKRIASGSLRQPDSDLAAEMYLLAERLLDENGYQQYEISNWSLPGRECRHNINYWENGEYLGFGAGAHSHIFSSRFMNVRSPFEYERILQKRCSLRPSGPREELLATSPWKYLFKHGCPIAELEPIDRDTAMLDSLILGLRMTRGINTAFDPYTSINLDYADELSRLETDGLIERSGVSIRLTSLGRLLSNEVFVRLLMHQKKHLKKLPSPNLSQGDVFS